MSRHTRALLACALTIGLLPSCASAAFEVNLGQGDTGPAVQALQQFLISQGLLSSDNATGYFGKLTSGAVKAYQTSQGIIPATGFFGPVTRASVNGASTSTAATVVLSTQVAQLQEQVKKLAQQLSNLSVPTFTSSQPIIITIPATTSSSTVLTSVQGAPALSVTSPIASSTYSAGSSVTLSWASAYAPSGAVVQLDLVDAGGAVVGDGAVCTASGVTGSCVWTIPTTQAVGQYKIRARLQSQYTCRNSCASQSTATVYYKEAFSGVFSIQRQAY